MSFLREPEAEPIPGYRLIELLGTGGFGEVWKCEAPGGLYKAIKFVYGNLDSVDGDNFRAEQELSALNRVKEIRHPFVLSMDRIEVVQGELVIVMELADKSLHDRYVECQAAGLIGIPRNDLLRYMRDAAEALDHMIEKYHLQHLDIKPRNLFLISDRVKVADFGLVKQIERQSGMLNGITPLYAPPETFQGRISEHSDQYSLALVYHELLTGRRPFSGKTARQMILQHSQEPPELRALPEAERSVVGRALAKEPSDRWPNCMAFVRALYTARVQPRAEPVVEHHVAGQRPQSMLDTMEGVFLEDSSDENGQHGDGAVASAEQAPEEMSHLGITVNLPDSGALRPTLVIGLGGFGRRAIQELRARLVDRFGDLAKLPLVHFLYMDPDLEEVRAAVKGTRELACAAAEVCHVHLQPVGNYRRRILEQLLEWLPREKLYNIPRSLQTEGSRALGRLAFADNHLRIIARLRREIQGITNPDALYESVSQTGLALRDNRPRIYIIASAGGGSSGMLPDLGYAMRRLLNQLHHPDAEINVFLFCGAPEDPASPKTEQANIYACLTELNHFTDPGVRFTAQYGADGPRTVDQGQPFNQTYLLKLANRSPTALRDVVAHLASYLFHELTTPFGIRLDRLRMAASAGGLTPFRSFGTYAVWFPRGLLLRAASRRACIQLIEKWQREGPPTAKAEIEAACARLTTDPEFRFETLCVRIQENAAFTLEDNLTGALTGLLSKLEEQSQASIALDDPANWAQQALIRVQEWIGVRHRLDTESGWRRSRLGKALSAAVLKLVGDWDQHWADAAYQLMEHPGLRVAAAQAALENLARCCQELSASQHTLLEAQVQKTAVAWQHLETALEACQCGAGGFTLFGNRSRRLLRVFMDHLAAFSRQRLVEEVVSAGILFLNTLQSRLHDRLRELEICRQRLHHAQEALASPALEANGFLSADDLAPSQAPSSPEAYWEMIRETQTARPVLPRGETDLGEAAARFISSLTEEQWGQLDQLLHDQVLAPRGGLHRACLATGDIGRLLAQPLQDQAALCLAEHLPVTDVAQAELASGPGQSVADKIMASLNMAAPSISASNDENQQAFLLIPAGDHGKRFGEVAKQAMSSINLVKVPGQADLMFCREQGHLPPADVQRVFRTCRQAYEQSAVAPSVSPHARFDILDWVPLDP
jgi:eukaryotic-like serine/threonine-protein kinase